MKSLKPKNKFLWNFLRDSFAWSLDWKNMELSKILLGVSFRTCWIFKRTLYGEKLEWYLARFPAFLVIRNFPKRTANAFARARQFFRAFASSRQHFLVQRSQYTNVHRRWRTLADACEHCVRRSFWAVANDQNSARS